jgi:hypothetical protein
MWKNIFSKTVLGAAAGAAFHVASDPKNPIVWGESLSIVFAAWGARRAIAKGPTDPPA